MTQTMQEAQTKQDVEESRDCTRCQGKQYLIASNLGFGKYKCIECEMLVGFDLEAEEGKREFLIHRGLCFKYDRELPNVMLGIRLISQEMRL